MRLWYVRHPYIPLTGIALKVPSNVHCEDVEQMKYPPLLPAEFRSLQMDSLSAIYLNEQ